MENSSVEEWNENKKVLKTEGDDECVSDKLLFLVWMRFLDNNVYLGYQFGGFEEGESCAGKSGISQCDHEWTD